MAAYIPGQHYLGAPRPIDKSNPPLAFITPYGTDSAAKKRMDTVEQWTGRDNKDRYLAVVDNDASKGFSIGEEVRRWSTDNVVWRINDPRGFQLEISSGNMAYLLAECRIMRGHIEDELHWCRDGADNYLLPTASEKYQEFKANTDAMTSGVTIKDINRGDRIRIQSGEEGVYLGAYFVVQFSEWLNSGRKLINVRRRVIMRRANNKYHDMSAFKGISLISKGAPEDDRSYAEEIDPAALDGGRNNFAIVDKKPKEQDILDSLKLVDANVGTEFGSNGATFYVDRDASVFQISGYGGTYPQLTRVHFSTNNNTIETESVRVDDGTRHYGMSGLMLTREAISDIILDTKNMKSLQATVNGKEYLVRE